VNFHRLIHELGDEAREHVPNLAVAEHAAPPTATAAHCGRPAHRAPISVTETLDTVRIDMQALTHTANCTRCTEIRVETCLNIRATRLAKAIVPLRRIKLIACTDNRYAHWY
jgi:hypothetical protein